MNETLLLCPFCSGPAEVCEADERYAPHRYWVLCRTCHACPGEHATKAEAIAAWNRRAPQQGRTEIEAALREARVVLALSDGEGRRAAIHAPEDPAVAVLCEQVGYGAVMDAAARLWFRKDSVGAHTTGACAATVRDTLTLIDRALSSSAPAKEEGR